MHAHVAISRSAGGWFTERRHRLSDLPRCCGELDLQPFQLPSLPSEGHTGFPHTHTHARRLHISACSRRWCEFLNTLITVLDLVRACLPNCIFGLLMLENKPSLDSAGGFSLPLAGGAPVFAHGAVLLTVEHLCSCCRVKVAVCVHAH